MSESRGIGPSVCFVSLRCAAGLQKEIDSLCAGFSRNGWRTHQVLAAGYRSYRAAAPGIDFVEISGGYGGMLRDVCREMTTQRIRECIRVRRPDLVIFYNQSPLNLQVLRLRRELPGCRFALCLHDPWKPEKRRYGLRYALTYSAVEMLQQITVSRLDWVITLSDFGTTLFRTYYPRYRGRHLQARILLPARASRGDRSRTVQSIIGRINASTGHEHFLAWAAAVRSMRADFTFEIVTSSPAAAAPEFRGMVEAAGVLLSYRPVLSEEDIEAAIARSSCVFRLDAELTQSGVIPLCFRSGTPVIANDIPGLRQHVRSGRTGFLLGETESTETLVAQFDAFRQDAARFAEECRAEFTQEWDERNFERYYAPLLARP